MDTPAARLRFRLKALWQHFTGTSVDTCLAPGNVVTSARLDAQKIRLISHEFVASGSQSGNLSYTPPILFTLQPPSIFNQYPIDSQQSYGVFLTGIHWLDHTPATNIQQIFEQETSTWPRGQALALYISQWAISDIPRCGVLTMGHQFNVRPVVHPHALDLTTYGFTRRAPTMDDEWETSAFESRHQGPTGQSAYPHLTLLSTQSSEGQEGRITLGELTIIITAMYNRSRQPAVFDDRAAEKQDDEDETWRPVERDANMLYAHERRFPVLMVSLLGPHHARILHACLHGEDLVIRMSPLHDWTNLDTLTLMGCALLAWPLTE